MSGVRCQVSGVRCQVSGEKSEIKTHLLQKAVMHRSDVDEGVWVGVFAQKILENWTDRGQKHLMSPHSLTVFTCQGDIV